MYTNYFPSWKPTALNNWNKFEDCFFLLDDKGNKWFCVFVIEDDNNNFVTITTTREFPELKFCIQQGIVFEMYYSNSKSQYQKEVSEDGFFFNIKEVK